MFPKRTGIFNFLYKMFIKLWEWVPEWSNYLSNFWYSFDREAQPHDKSSRSQLMAVGARSLLIFVFFACRLLLIPIHTDTKGGRRARTHAHSHTQFFIQFSFLSREITHTSEWAEVWWVTRPKLRCSRKEILINLPVFCEVVNINQ